MPKKINTSEIRRCARALDRCANEVQTKMISALRNIDGQAQQAVEGEVQTALESRIESLQFDSRRSRNHLSAIAESLYRYANLLDEADKAAAQMINNR